MWNIVCDDCVGLKRCLLEPALLPQLTGTSSIKLDFTPTSEWRRFILALSGLSDLNSSLYYAPR